MSGRRAAIYARVSPKPRRQGHVVVAEETSVPLQVDDCRALAERNGDDVVAVFTDSLVSAFSEKPRKEFEELLSRLGEFDVVYAWAPDRFIRKPPELERVAPTLEAAGVTVETVHAGAWDLATAEGIFNARIHGAIAARESQLKRERIKRKHRSLAENGESSGGNRAYGFKPGNAEVEPAEAVEVVAMAERFLAGASLRSIATDLNARQVPTAKGLRWSPGTVRGLLENPRIAGIRTGTDQARNGRRGPRRELCTAKWPGLISVEDFRRVQALLAATARERGAEARLLTGLLECQRCGAKLTASKRAAKAGAHPIYECNRQTGAERGCRRNSIRADHLEPILVAAFLDYASGWRAPDRTAEVIAAEAELATVAAKRAEMGRHLAADTIDVGTVAAAEAGLRDRERRANEVIRRDVAERHSPLTAMFDGDLDERWPTMDLAAQRAALSTFVERVVIGPFRPTGKGFDPDRIVAIEYRGESIP